MPVIFKLEIAIAAGEPDRVIPWYDRMSQAQPRYGLSRGVPAHADRVAEAVMDSHPERALQIYSAALDAQLPQAQPSSYEAAAGYLKKLRPIYETRGRPGEWDVLLVSIRERYRNRPRFMEILGRLEGRTILDSARPKPR